jgi:hypothetical protein
MEPPQNPAGSFQPIENPSAQQRAEYIQIIAQAPANLRKLVDGLSDQQLDVCYRNWTIRQIVHHLADSHVHAYARFKWTLTEDTPTIKPYDEGRWVELADARTGDVRAALALFEALHAQWVQLLNAMTEEQFARAFYHPETKKTVTLNASLGTYAWHCKHHTAQIAWLREQRAWSQPK